MLPGLTAEEARDLVLSVGTHHGKRRLSPVEVAELFQKAMMVGASSDDCARFVSLKGPTMVSRFLRLFNLSPEIRHIVDWGQTGATMSFASACFLAELSKDEQNLLAIRLMENQMKKEEVRQIVQIRKRSQRHISECITEVLGMRPTVIKKYLFLGAVVDETTKTRLEILQQSERDRLFSAVLSELYRLPPKTSARLGIDRFTIVTDEEGAAMLNQNKPYNFEENINRTLSAKVSKE